MLEITTVLDPIASEVLGFTSMHEHTVCDVSVFRRRLEAFLPPDLPIAPDDPLQLGNLGLLKHAFILARDVMDLREEALITAEVAEFKAAGRRAMVDMSTPGIRCDPTALCRISQATGVHIIATTGLYAEDSWPEAFHRMTLEDFRGYMRQEIEVGIEGTNLRAGHLKFAVTDSTMLTATPFSNRQQTALQAAVQVSNETGLSPSVHPPLDTPDSVREVIRFMR